MGFNVGYGWWKPAASKMQPLPDMQIRDDPKKGLHDVRSFVGACNFYRRHIHNFTYSSAPLTDLIKKTTPPRWTAREEECFQELKKKIASSNCLGVPRLLVHIPQGVGDEEKARWVVEEDRGKQELRVYPQPVQMLAQVRGGLDMVELNEYLEGKVGQRVHYPNALRPESLPKRLQTRRLQAITGQVPVRETIMKWYRHKGMDLQEEYMRCHCGQGQETYEHFMRCAQYKGIQEPLVRDQDVPLLKKGARGRSTVERELGKEGHRKGLWHMVIVKPLWRALQEHTVAPEAMAHRLLRRMVEHLQERMACRETQLEARADDMRDPVTKRVDMAVIRYNPKTTEMAVRRRPDWRPRRSGAETGMEDREGDEQRDRLMARRRKRIRQI